MDDEEPSRPALLRADPRSSISSRLSFAIRRSLRLGPKKTTFGLTSTGSPILKEETELERLESGWEEQPQTRVGNFFTEYANVKVEPCDKRYGTLAELMRLLQLARRTPIKKFLRYNDWPIGHHIRHELWKELCKDRNYDANRELYKREVEELTHKGKSLDKITAHFLTASGTVINNYDLTEEGAIALQRLLVVIECVRPDVTYVPILYPLCAIFLHYLKEEDAFACAMHLLRGSEYLHQSSISVIASGRTLLALIKKHRNSVYHTLKKRAGVTEDKDLAEIFLKWQNWIFLYLPFSYVVRVVDCFLFEGRKILLRVGLALAYVWSKYKARQNALFANKSREERFSLLLNHLTETAKNCPISVQTLLDAAVGIRNLKGTTIAKYQKAFEEIVREEEASKVEVTDSAAAPISLTRRISAYVYAKPFSSDIVDSSVANALMCAFPERLQFDTPQLLFRLTDDGVSFTNFWAKIEEADQTLFIIETDSKSIFGAFCSASWAERKDRRTKTKFFGTGESFVWKLDRHSNMPVIYNWIGQTSNQPDQCPQYFLAADDKTLIIGGGNGDAISVREDLYKGLTSYCSTFGNPPLVDERDFTISELEVFSVQSSQAE